MTNSTTTEARRPARVALAILTGEEELTAESARFLFDSYRRHRGYTVDMAVQQVAFQTGADMRDVQRLLTGYAEGY